MHGKHSASMSIASVDAKSACEYVYEWIECRSSEERIHHQEWSRNANASSGKKRVQEEKRRGKRKRGV